MICLVKVVGVFIEIDVGIGRFVISFVYWKVVFVVCYIVFFICNWNLDKI